VNRRSKVLFLLKLIVRESKYSVEEVSETMADTINKNVLIVERGWMIWVESLYLRGRVELARPA
jgi:hypothetical protein